MVDDLLVKLHQVAENGEVACSDAHALAAELDMSPQELGKHVNRAGDLRFYRCQLGLFGFGSKAKGEHKIILAAARVPADIEAAITQLAPDGRISCADVWALAERFKYPRLGMANIIQTMGLKVTPCQLLCF